MSATEFNGNSSSDFGSAEAKARAAAQGAAPTTESANAAAQRGLFQRGTQWSAEQQWEFNRAVAAALTETIQACQDAMVNQQARIRSVAGEVDALRVMTTRLDELHARVRALDGRIDDEATARMSLSESAEELNARVHQVAVDLDEKVRAARAEIAAVQESATSASAAVGRECEARAAAMAQHAETHAAATAQQLEAMRNEVRERIQHLLDEQRVCVRQLALQTSEEATLADRARRATELRLDELARQVDALARSALSNA